MIFFRTLTYTIGLIKKATGAIIEIFWDTEERTWDQIDDNWQDWGN